MDALFSSWGTWNRLQDPSAINSAMINPLDNKGCFEGFVLTWDPRKEKFSCKSSDSQLEAICYSPPIVGNNNNNVYFKSLSYTNVLFKLEMNALQNKIF